jgi:hypothetical protein
MILARLTRSLRRQDWTTLAVEFVLVVAGVFVALQADNWNQQRVAERKFRSELALLQAELRDDRVPLALTIERIEHNLTVLTAFQRAFHGETSASYGERREAFVPALLGGITSFMRRARVDRLLGSDGILEERFESLRRELEKWNRTWNGYLEMSDERLSYRNKVILPLFTETHSQVTRAERIFRDTPYRLDASGRDDELRDLLADPRVENAIVIKLLIEKEALDHAKHLDQVSELVIAEIDRMLAASPR